MVGRLIRFGLTALALITISTPAYAIPVALVVAITGLSTILATVVAVLVNVGLSLLAGLIFGPKTPKQKPQTNATTLQLGEVARQVVFGKDVAVAGSLLQAFNTGGNYGTRWEVVVYALADHRCGGLKGVYVNDEFHAITADGAVPDIRTSDGHTMLYLWFRDGSAGQTVPDVLKTGTPNSDNFPGGPTRAEDGFVDGDFSGVCYVVMAYRADKPGDSSPSWPGGRPRFLFVLTGGAFCYDPRKDSTVLGGSGTHRWDTPSTWEVSDNPIVCRYNWVRGIYALDQVNQPDMLLVGRGLSALEAPPENVAAYANICDEDVFKAGGGTENRYTLGGVINADDDFITVEEKFAACVAGTIIQPSGGVEIDPGVAKVAVEAITDDDLVGTVRVNNFRSDGDEQWLNTVVAQYIEPTQKYQQHAAPVRRDYADVAADGKSRELSLQLDYVVSGTQAQRCGEIARRTGRLLRTAAITLGPTHAGIEEGDWIEWTSDRYLAGDTVEWRVESYSLDEKLQNTLTLREIESQVYEWDTSLELDDGSIAGSPTSQPGELEAPDAGDWSMAGGTITGPTGALPVLIITGAVDQGVLEAIDAVRFEYRLHVDGLDDDEGWGGASTEPVTITKKEIVVAPGNEYDASVRYSIGGYVGPRLILGGGMSGDMSSPSVVVTAVSSVTIEADYTGTIQSSQFPKVVQVAVSSAGSDITLENDTDYAITTSGGITASVDTTDGSSTKGQISITGMTVVDGVISLVVTVGGVAQPSVLVQVHRNDSAVPVTGSKLSSTSTFIPPTTGSYAAIIADFVGIVVAGGEQLYGSGTIAFAPGFTFEDGQTFTAKWQHSPTGMATWTDFAAGQTSTAYKTTFFAEVAAQLTLSQSANPGAGTYDVRIVGLEGGSHTSHHFTRYGGSVTIEAKV